MRARNLTRRSVIAGAGATALVTAADARPLFMRGGKPGNAAVDMFTFHFVEHSGNSGVLGKLKGAFIFKKGQMPAGNRITIPGDGRVQFSGWSTYPNGDLRYCVFDIDDPTPFSAYEIRAYTAYREVGVWQNNTDVKTLAQVLSGTDFHADISNLSGAIDGSLPDHVWSINAHAAVPTRVEQIAHGNVCPGWRLWGMATNGGTEHTHLKANTYIYAHLDTGGNVIAWEPTPCPALDWWSIPAWGGSAPKQKYTYTVDFKEGTTPIETYGGSIDSLGNRSATVEHCYKSRWAMVRLDDDYEAGQPHWYGASDRPTLLYVPPIDFWYETDLVPRIDRGLTFTMPAFWSTGITEYGVYQGRLYQPGSAQADRDSTVGTSTYPGRGIMTKPACMALTALAKVETNPTIANIQDAAAKVRIARLVDFCGMHIPQHRVSNDLRQRPGDASPDTANTVTSMILGLSTTGPDFQSVGMPAPVHAYTAELGGGSIPPGYSHGYVSPPKLTPDVTSGTSVWVLANSTAHDTPWGKFSAMQGGYRMHVDHIVSRALHATQIRGGDGNSGSPAVIGYAQTITPPPHAVYPGATSTQYNGCPLRWYDAGESRAIGWALALTNGALLIPDDTPESAFIKAYCIDTRAAYIADCINDFPTPFTGSWVPSAKYSSQFQETLTAMFLFEAYFYTGDTRFRDAGFLQARNSLQWVSGAQSYVCGGRSNIALTRPDNRVEWTASTNEWMPQWYCTNSNDATATAATDTITQPKAGMLLWIPVDGDKIIAGTISAQQGNLDPLPDLTLGKEYELANVVDGGTNWQFQIRDPDTSSIVPIAADMASVPFGFLLASFGTIPPPTSGAQNTIGDLDTYHIFARCAFTMSDRAGDPNITQTMRDLYEEMYQWVRLNNFNNGAQPAWAFEAA